MGDQTDIAVDKIEGIVKGFWWIMPNIGIAAVVLIIFIVLALVVRTSVFRLLHHRREDLAALLASFAKWAVIGLGALVVSAIVFPSVRPADILATLGIGSVAIGFAFKDILQNWFAGLLILLRQPFRTGDQIVVGSHEGTVEHVEARATLLKTYDGRRVVIPNSEVYTRSVVVNTAFDKRRSEYELGIGYGDDVEEARRVILRVLERIEGVEANPRPEVIAWDLADSSVVLKLRWWTASRRSALVEARGRVIPAVKHALDEAGIDIPFPTRVMLFHDQTEETDGIRGRQREGWPAGDAVPEARPTSRITILSNGAQADTGSVEADAPRVSRPRRRPSRSNGEA